MNQHLPKILVVFQVAIAAILVVSAKSAAANAIVLALVGIGVAIGLWAIWTIGPSRVSVMPDVKEDTVLITSGPYRFVRHPMYTALWLACLGAAICPMTLWKMLALALLALVLDRKAAVEESQLRSRFEAYGGYASHTKRFIPFIW